MMDLLLRNDEFILKLMEFCSLGAPYGGDVSENAAGIRRELVSLV